MIDCLVQSVKTERLYYSLLTGRTSYRAFFPCNVKFRHILLPLGFLPLFTAEAAYLLRSTQVLDRFHGGVRYVYRIRGMTDDLGQNVLDPSEFHNCANRGPRYNSGTGSGGAQQDLCRSEFPYYGMRNGVSDFFKVD